MAIVWDEFIGPWIAAALGIIFGVSVSLFFIMVFFG
jgi:phosphatidylglycerophosphatase A